MIGFLGDSAISFCYVFPEQKMQWQLWFNLHGSSSSKVNLHSRVDLKAMETLSSHITNYFAECASRDDGEFWI